MSSLLFFFIMLSSWFLSSVTTTTNALTISPNFLSSVIESTVRANSGNNLRDNVLLAPPQDKIKLPKHMHTGLVLIPGALVKPEQYVDVVRAIQNESKQAVWVSIPRIQPVANPLNIGISVSSAVERLKTYGFPGTKTFVAGHSLGGAFLRNMFDQNLVSTNQIEGLIHLGCIMARESKNDRHTNEIPHMVVAGDLDGLVRASRVAEDYHRHVLQKQKKNNNNNNDPNDVLRHAVVLVPGMNHFGYVSGEPPFMDEFRDLKGELSHEDSVKEVSSSVAEFMDYHRLKDPEQVSSLLSKMDRTSEYLQPIINAMKLEGSYHLDQIPCHLCEEDGSDGCCDDCIEGSPWAAMIQRDIAPEGVEYGEIKDEFHQSWWINPLHDPPFYHPKIHAADMISEFTSYENATAMMNTTRVSSADFQKIINMGTVSEPVYEKPDMYLFDAGFFSNAALELRCKFNSRQAILQAAGIDVPHESECGTCSKMNERTIQWALEQVPESVRQRYLDRGIKLVTGKDIEHSAGPTWIWSYMDYRRVDDKTMEIDSHIMSTPLDHPVPASGGKLYCKLLSPAKALDWIYTDSLRPSTEASKFYHDVLLSPSNLLKYTVEQSQNSIREVADPFFVPKSLLRVGFGGLSLAAELNRKSFK
jgi:hypothetical protein